MKTLKVIIFFLCCLPSLYAQHENLLKLPDFIPAKDRIAFTLYTVHENTVKLTAQFYPIQNTEPFRAKIQVKENGKWKNKQDVEIIYPGYTAHFRLENWDDTKESSYRVVHNNRAFYEGIIKQNPREKEDFTVAAFSCMSLYPKHGGQQSMDDVVENLKHLKPDLLFFAGDQVYDHSQHYLYWLKFGEIFKDIMRNTPTITIPDDHDVGQSNLWGAGGKKATSRRGTSGGYYMPASYVKEVERVQTSHLPDPYDPTPIEQGIGVYYTDLKWGGLSFAILEDRKFKSGLEGVIKQQGPQLDAVLVPGIDPMIFDVPEATLLGERQLKFLDDWTTDWKDAEMKSVLSATVFAYTSTYSGVYGKEVYADFDSNGWPQTGRNKALSVIRKSFSCMIAGDQHLGTMIQHGVDDWQDAGYSFTVPAIANYWPRWWEPTKKSVNSIKGLPSYCGNYFDGFKNKITMYAAANPTLNLKNNTNDLLESRGAGFGIIRFNKTNRKITFECWARNKDMSNSVNKPYSGWPFTIDQQENYQINKGYQLPTIHTKEEDQVVTIKTSTDNKVISSLRINGTTYQPKVPYQGKFNIEIGEGDHKQIFNKIEASKRNKKSIIIRNN
jgi:hypothetical protein